MLELLFVVVAVYHFFCFVLHSLRVSLGLARRWYSLYTHSLARSHTALFLFCYFTSIQRNAMNSMDCCYCGCCYCFVLFSSYCFHFQWVLVPLPPPFFIVSQIMPFARFSSFSLCTCLLYERNYSECQSSQRKCLKIVFVFVSNWNLFGVLSFSRISNSDAVPGKSAGLLLSVELFIGGSFERRVSVSVSGYWMQFDIIIFICRIVLSVCWTNERKWHQLRLVMYKWPLLPLPHIRVHTHTHSQAVSHSTISPFQMK